MEMSEDFDGEMEDMPEGDEEQDSEGEDSGGMRKRVESFLNLPNVLVHAWNSDTVLPPCR